MTSKTPVESMMPRSSSGARSVIPPLIAKKSVDARNSRNWRRRLSPPPGPLGPVRPPTSIRILSVSSSGTSCRQLVDHRALRRSWHNTAKAHVEYFATAHLDRRRTASRDLETVRSTTAAREDSSFASDPWRA
jgi:hypothetical protein